MPNSKPNQPVSQLTQAPGPLAVSKINPRYFAVAAGSDEAGEKLVYLTGAHINNNFHDGLGPGKDCSANPETYDFDLHLKFLKEHGHNFARLWRWELFRSQVGGGSFHFCASPQPWLRTGPGTATDGQPKFDMNQFNPAYF